MSEYFRILNRIESEERRRDLDDEAKPVAKIVQHAEAVEAAEPSEPGEAAPVREPVRPVERPREPAPAPAKRRGNVAEIAPVPEPRPRPARPARVRTPSLPDDGQRAAFARIFENLLVATEGDRLSSLIVAGASSMEAVDRVTAGIAAEANRRELRVLVADLELRESRSLLRERTRYLSGPTIANGSEPASGLAPTSFSMKWGPLPEAAVQWLQAAAGVNDLVLVEGPPLGTTLDAALLARACDGMVIVVEPGVTTRESLESAVSKAKSVGCKILGLVMSGTHENVPGWMRQLVGQGGSL